MRSTSAPPCSTPSGARSPVLKERARDNSGQCPAKETKLRTETPSASILAAPPRSGRSMTKQAAATSAPICCKSLMAAFRGSPGRDQIVDEDHAFALGDRIVMHLHVVEAILQGIGDGDGRVRELAFLADRHEAGRQLMRHRAAQDEAARLDAGDLVDFRSGPGLDELVDRAAKGFRVAEQRRDVAKQNALLRVIRDRANCVGEKHGPNSFKSVDAQSIAHPPCERHRPSGFADATFEKAKSS